MFEKPRPSTYKQYQAIWGIWWTLKCLNREWIERTRVGGVMKQTLVCLETFKREKESQIKIESYRNYLQLLSCDELISEAMAFMNLLKTNGEKEFARKGLVLFSELVERLESENRFVGKELREIQEKLAKNFEKLT